MRFQETGVSLGELDRAVELEVLLFARRNRNRCMSSYLPLIFEVPQDLIDNIAVESKSKHSYTVLYMFSCVFTPQPH